MSALGAAFLAGLNAGQLIFLLINILYFHIIEMVLGIWSSRDELTKLRKVEKTFVPNIGNYNRVSSRMKNWERALERFKQWYSE